MLVLVRHGESELNASGCLVGRLDPALTELGERQAAAAGRLLGPVGGILTSPLQRARRTAELLGAGVEPEVEQRLIEVDYGELDGTPLGEVAPELWRSWLTDPDFCPPGGESLVALAGRVEPLLEELFAHGGPARQSEDLVVVSHVSPIKAAVAWALRADPLVAWRLRLSTGSVTRIAMGPHGPALVSFNETASLD